MKNQFFKLTLVSASVFFISGCGGGSGSNSAGGKNGDLASSPSWQNLKMDGAVKEGTYENRLLLTLDKPNKMLVVHLPTLALPVLVGNLNQIVTIPKLPGASFNLQQAADGNVEMVLNIPLSLVMRGATFLGSSQKLPNGDALPAIPDGELPGLAIDLNNQGSVKGYLYLGTATLGAFVTTQFNPMVSMQLPIYQNNGAVLGYLTTVPDKNGFPGGIFLSVKIPQDIARIIDDVT